MPSQRSQTLKNKYYMFHFYKNLEKQNSSIVTESRSFVVGVGDIH